MVWRKKKNANWSDSRFSLHSGQRSEVKEMRATESRELIQEPINYIIRLKLSRQGGPEMNNLRRARKKSRIWPILSSRISAKSRSNWHEHKDKPCQAEAWSSPRTSGSEPTETHRTSSTSGKKRSWRSNLAHWKTTRLQSTDSREQNLQTGESTKTKTSTSQSKAPTGSALASPGRNTLRPQLESQTINNLTILRTLS